MRVGDGGGLQRRLGDSGRLGGLAPEIGVSEKTGSALRVVDDRDLEERVCRALTAEQLLSEEGEEGDVVDDGFGDSSPGSTRWSRQVTTSICAAGGPSGTGV